MLPAEFDLIPKVKGRGSAVQFSRDPPLLLPACLCGPTAKLADLDNNGCWDQLIHLQLTSTGDYTPCK